MPKATQIKRTKTGCLSCRYARKKCDEIKPVCTLCAKKNISCVWSQFKKQSLTQFITKQGQDLFEDVDRKKLIRSKTGCLQCRKGRKKCDESRPICQRCFNKGVGCSYLETVSEFTTSESPTSSASSIYFSSPSPFPDDITDLAVINASPLPPSPTEPSNMQIESFNVSHSIHVANSQMTMINVFFNNVIENLIPKKSLPFISEITYEAIKNSPCVRDTITSLSTAFVFNVDPTNQLVLKNPNFFQKSTTVEDKLHSIIFTVLISLYAETKSEMIIDNIQHALQLATNFNPKTPSKKFKIILESIIYNFAVSIITTPLTSIIQNPFRLFEKWRCMFPRFPDLGSNPLLGPSLDVFIILAKVSYVFKFPHLLNKHYNQLMEQIDHILLTQPMDMISEDLILPIYPSTYISQLSSKLLLLYLKEQRDSLEFNFIISEILFILKQKSDHTDGDIEVCGLWGIFIFGLNLTNKVDQMFLVDRFQECWERTRNIGFLKSLQKFNVAWEKNIGFDILRDESFISDLRLN